MAKRAATKVEAQTVMVELPIGDLPIDGYECQQMQNGRINLSPPGVHVEAQLGHDAAAAFIRVRNGLRDANAKLANGRPVYSNADTLRYVMEMVANG